MVDSCSCARVLLVTPRREMKGFAFIEFIDERDAKDAQAEMDRSLVNGRELQVVYAQACALFPSKLCCVAPVLVHFLDAGRLFVAGTPQDTGGNAPHCVSHLMCRALLLALHALPCGWSCSWCAAPVVWLRSVGLRLVAQGQGLGIAVTVAALAPVTGGTRADHEAAAGTAGVTHALAVVTAAGVIALTRVIVGVVTHALHAVTVTFHHVRIETKSRKLSSSPARLSRLVPALLLHAAGVYACECLCCFSWLFRAQLGWLFCAHLASCAWLTSRGCVCAQVTFRFSFAVQEPITLPLICQRGAPCAHAHL